MNDGYATKLEGVDESIKSFDNISYTKLRMTFQQTIYDALMKIKAQSDANERSVYTKRRNGLGESRIDISAEGDSGRVKIARFKNDSKYPHSAKTDYRLKWFENGTQDRYSKRSKSYESGKEASNHSHHKRVVYSGGLFRGKMPTRPFFQPAVESTKNEVDRYMQNEINNKIRKLFEQK